MIQDARVLREEWVPADLEHRNQKLNELSNALHPVSQGRRAEDAFLFGPSGAGKTCLARFMLNQLQTEVPDANVQYLNCWQDYSRYQVLYQVLDGFLNTAKIHRQSTATAELLRRVRDYSGEPYVVVLDEADQLEDKGVLYDLYQVEKISMVLIANREEELFAQLDDRLVSRLHGARRIYLDKYHQNELADILRNRADVGLKRGAVRRSQLEEIADVAAGDARIAIALLRSAANEAESREASRITSEIIEAVVPKAKSSIQRKTLDMLREDQQLLYDIIAEQDGIAPNELYELYHEQADDPKSDRTVRNYLQKMVHYNLVRAEGEKRGRTYRVIQPD